MENLILPEENIIESTYHTLTWDDIPEQYYPVEVQSPDGEITQLFERMPPIRKYKLFIGNFNEDGKGLDKIFNKLHGAGHEDEVELHIASRGGYVDETIQFVDTLNAAFNSITAYLNYGYSGGALLFLACDVRIVYEHSDFMLHSYSTGWVGKRNEVLAQAEHTDKRIQKYTDKLIKPYLSKKERKKLANGKDFWMDSDEMIKRGIATHIISNKELLTAEEYLKKDLDKNIDKKINKNKK